MKKIELISVPVTDQEVAKSFYVKLGFEVIVEAPMGNGQNWVQLGLPGTETSITLVNWFPKMQAGCLQGILILTEDIEAEVKEIQSKGVIVDKIDDTPWGKFASFRDPDGNGWTFHQK